MTFAGGFYGFGWMRGGWFCLRLLLFYEYYAWRIFGLRAGFDCLGVWVLDVSLLVWVCCWCGTCMMCFCCFGRFLCNLDLWFCVVG